jgi:DNA invertase Pin-like site-specific DNA recombinase
MTATLLGYARVSTTKQDLERQLDALTKAGVAENRIYVDKKGGGAKVDRPGLSALIDYARDGDLIIVHTLDRLGRNLRETLNLIHDLQSRGVGLKTLADPLPVDTTDASPMGQIAVALLALFAEMERNWNRDRVAHARAVAAAQGRQIGRPRDASDYRIRKARDLKESGLTVAQVAAKTGISEATLYRRWAELRQAEQAEA